MVEQGFRGGKNKGLKRDMDKGFRGGKNKGLKGVRTRN